MPPIQFRPWPKTTPVVRDVSLVVPYRTGAWSAILDIAEQARSEWCPVVRLVFLKANTEVCLHGEAQYVFRVVFHSSQPLPKSRISECMKYLRGRWDWALEQFAAKEH